MVAIDLGASTGRVLFAELGESVLTESFRFANLPVVMPDGIYWDIYALWQNILEGIRRVGDAHNIVSIGIDSWGVDYGLLDRTGALIALPYHYRDTRSCAARVDVESVVDAETIFNQSGIASNNINTVYQLVAGKSSPRQQIAERFLLISDLIVYWLTGEVGYELTNASTTGLMLAHSDRWNWSLIEMLGLPRSMFGPIRYPGDRVGLISSSVAREVGAAISTGSLVTLTASHDTASAVAAIKSRHSGQCAYVSLGTWSLAGLVVPAPVMTQRAFRAGFTNERSADGARLFHRNLVGLWLVDECLRSWKRKGRSNELAALIRGASEVAVGRSVVDIDEPRLSERDDMPTALASLCLGFCPEPGNEAEFVRCAIDSLVLGIRRTLRAAIDISGACVDAVNIVGGGCRIELLCQSIADASGMDVFAGPSEATAAGNILLQLAGLGLQGKGRGLVGDNQLRKYEPTRTEVWDEIDQRTPNARVNQHKFSR